MLDTGAVRPLFPGVEGRTYLDAASLGLVSTRTAEAVRSFVDLALSPPPGDTGEQHVRLARRRAQARPALARYLQADAGSIALMENASQGLSLAAASIPLQAGDNVVLLRSDYLQTAVPWARRSKREGAELRFVAPREGRIELDDVAGAMDRRTEALCLSSVQWTTGQRLDLDALCQMARDHAAWLVLDGAQHVGSVRLDLARTPVDFLACSGHKWLNCPFGSGFLHVGRRAAAELEPPLVGFLGAEQPAGGWGAYFADPQASAEDLLTLPHTARPWETGGTPNFPGGVALHAASELLLELGPAAVEEHILELGGRLQERLRALGVQVITPSQSSQRAGIVTFRWGAGVEDEQAALSALQERGVQLSLRYGGGLGGLRAAVHLFNDEDDVDRLVEELAALR
jgi:selenocysteine lyase/cysteine desulfurase